MTSKVFGIGLHKTATSSLNEALKMMGYDSWHWNSAHQAKAIWQQMNQLGFSRVVEEYHAITDLPTPLLFRQLDKAYPNSKFILTLRPAAKWIESVKRHYRADTNKYREIWDNDPFTHRVHQLLYGTKEFNVDVMLQRYKKHTDEVIEYFNGSGRLLVLDGEHDFKRLGYFLKQPVPAKPYPRTYVSQ